MPSRLRCAVGLLALLASPLAAQRPDSASRELPPFTWELAADGVADLSPENPTRPDSTRLALRALEFSGSGAISPRATVATSVVLLETGRVAVDEASLELPLPLGMTLRGGRFPLPLGDWWGVHREANPLVDRPLATRRFVAPELLSGSGLRLGRAWQHLLANAAVVDRIVEPVDGRVTIERPNRLFSGLGYVARLDALFGHADGAGAPIQFSASGATSRIAQPLSAFAPQDSRRVNAVLSRQSVFTAGARWRNASDRLALCGEFLSQVNESEASVERRIPADIVNGGPYYRGPVGSYNGGYVMGSWRARPALDVIGRFESVQDPELGGRNRHGIGAGIQLRPDPRLVVRTAYEYRVSTGVHEHRILVEGAAATGMHLLERLR